MSIDLVKRETKFNTIAIHGITPVGSFSSSVCPKVGSLILTLQPGSNFSGKLANAEEGVKQSA